MLKSLLSFPWVLCFLNYFLNYFKQKALTQVPLGGFIPFIHPSDLSLLAPSWGRWGAGGVRNTTIIWLHRYKENFPLIKTFAVAHLLHAFSHSLWFFLGQWLWWVSCKFCPMDSVKFSTTDLSQAYFSPDLQGRDGAGHWCMDRSWFHFQPRWDLFISFPVDGIWECH